LLKEKDGIKNWVYMFSKPFLQGLNDPTIAQILHEVEAQVKASNFKNGQWYADYVRLRVLAIK
jgi:hypothetical protein